MTPAHAIDDLERPTDVQSGPGHVLPHGTRLRDYEITGLIGEGGFGIVYLAWDHSLQRKVAIKEYMPASMDSRLAGSSAIVVKSDRHLDTFKAGLRSFVNEARLLARFDHPALVKVYRFWEENGTAYMVMPFYEGPTLKTALAELGHVPSENELRSWLKPILDAIAVLHGGETWHQDIGADAILLTPLGPVLLGFDLAERALAAAQHTPAVALRPGFAAIEQYGSVAETTRGPWTDLYALAAVVYAAITGVAPPAATARLADDTMPPLSLVASGLYSQPFLAALDLALTVEPDLRPRDHLQFRSLMGDIDAPERVELIPRRDLMQEPFAAGPDRSREVTVPDRPLLTQAATSAPLPGASTQPQRAAKAEVAAAAPTPRPIEREVPSWMQPGGVRRAMGRRTVYGLLAVGCVLLLGIGGLALEFPGRATKPSAASPVVAPVVITAPVNGRPSTAVAPKTTASAARAYLAAPANDAERQARCIDILQKASLEQITAGETGFFKRECK
ncbi:MAG: protein kinase [Pseudomonadota bacterium]|nr:protein kinase [Pseudomonadota bacterium]